MKDERFYLLHIKECIGDILNYTVDGYDAFMASTLIQDAVIRKLQIMAESTIHLPEAIKAAHTEVNWRNIRGFRNVLVHDYLSIELDIVWEIIENDLSPLRNAVETMLKNMSNVMDATPSD